uniref:Uncharacterized protein n=1 Tax=Arundo donax TaxID=35708 RepID=A0A0A9B7V1_ARUDO
MADTGAATRSVLATRGVRRTTL